MANSIANHVLREFAPRLSVMLLVASISHMLNGHPLDQTLESKTPAGSVQVMCQSSRFPPVPENARPNCQSVRFGSEQTMLPIYAVCLSYMFLYQGKRCRKVCIFCIGDGAGLNE
ncbi:hypothetical protein BT63DRAFT_105462 [Microthyrium microscopicum]|uniref:Uncharacterized protein n=1 Tax=Microthyrium microscopicum TaxID=703497 RepID=A0A6A6TZK5_9PEZI|nr:hypothetical protein BT63DRAFT_105462 [Microthyrium microscopicum]